MQKSVDDLASEIKDSSEDMKDKACRVKAALDKELGCTEISRLSVSLDDH